MNSVKTRTNGMTNTGHQMISRKTLPHVVYCRIWRFADLQNCNELKSVPHCQYGYNHHHHQSTTNGGKLNDEQMVCINPYHYVRIECASSSQSNQAHHQPLTVYVPAKLQLQQSQQVPASSSSSMDAIMPTMGHLVASNANPSVGLIHDDLITGVSATSYIHSNLHTGANSPSPPSSASILSPSSIGWFLNLIYFQNTLNNVNNYIYTYVLFP